MNGEEREAYHQRLLISIRWRGDLIKRGIDEKYVEARVSLGLTTLRYKGFRYLGAETRYRYYECIKCGTSYLFIDGHIRCNGQKITDCLCQEK